MRSVSKPRTGLMRVCGRVVWKVNWSRSWDGWGRIEPDKSRVDWYPLALIPFQLACGGYGFRLYVLWLSFYLGIRAKGV